MTSSFSELSNGPAFRVAGAAIGLWAASFARDAVRIFSAIISLYASIPRECRAAAW